MGAWPPDAAQGRGWHPTCVPHVPVGWYTGRMAGGVTHVSSEPSGVAVPSLSLGCTPAPGGAQGTGTL